MFYAETRDGVMWWDHVIIMIYSGFEKKRYDDWLISDLIVKKPENFEFWKNFEFSKNC